MIVYWVTAAELLFYLCAVPLHLSLHFEFDGGMRLSVGIGFFDRTFIRERRLKKKGRRQSLRPELIVSFINHARIDSIRLSGRLCAGDAAGTAMITGGIAALEAALRPILPGLETDITPVFNASGIMVDVRGMIRVRAGQIILAAVYGARQYLIRRIEIWTGIPSKAS